MFAAIGLAWKLGGFRGVFKMIPRSVWIGLAVVIAVIGLVLLHQHKVHSFEATIRADERSLANAEWQKKFDTMRKNALDWKGKYETASGQLATARRNSYEEGLRSDAARAGSLLNNGPGAARCGQVNYPGASASASGRNAVSRPLDSGLGGMPSEGGSALIALPYNDFISVARQCDANRSESLTWRSHDSEQRALRAGMLAGPEKK
jgi:hypothetical protein